jgi:hypothetical protein
MVVSRLLPSSQTVINYGISLPLSQSSQWVLSSFFSIRRQLKMMVGFALYLNKRESQVECIVNDDGGWQVACANFSW